MTTQPQKNFCQSVLRVSVPLTVTLARKPMPIERVLKLVPGVMIQFDKAYNTPMTVEIGDRPIADGEIVKMGDKFGVRIGDILKPSERYVALTGDRRGADLGTSFRD